jgi:hypothetical protein
MFGTSQNYSRRSAELFLIGLLVNVKASTFTPHLSPHGYSLTLAQ